MWRPPTPGIRSSSRHCDGQRHAWCLGAAVQPLADGDSLANWRLTRVLTYIDANIAGPIRLADLAAAAGLSRMCFARQFRGATGVRPHEYVLRKRIQRAQRMLAETSDALVDIALGAGFQTQSHFTTVFKKIVGNTPCQWRRGLPDVA